MFEFGDPVSQAVIVPHPAKYRSVPGERIHVSSAEQAHPSLRLPTRPILQRYPHANTDVFCGWAPIMQAIEYRKLYIEPVRSREGDLEGEENGHLSQTVKFTGLLLAPNTGGLWTM